MYMSAGIQAVPALVVNNRHLVSGGQPVENYVKVLRRLRGARHREPSSVWVSLFSQQGSVFEPPDCQNGPIARLTSVIVLKAGRLHGRVFAF